MEKEIRKIGIDIMGDAPWGTHFCQFYQTKEDLVDVLVPYFKAGLENNEFCMWVTSEPLSEEEAKKAMRNAVPNFDRYLERGQMEIVPHIEWYLKDGAFDLRRVLDAWIDKLDQALAKGYDGIRVTGNTAWLEKNDWRSFADYEEEVNDVIGEYRMMAVCTYSLDKCGASEVINVVRNHQFALVRRRGKWELIEGSELKRAKEALKRSEMRLKNIFAASPDAITVIDLNGNIVECNQATLDMLGFSSKEELIGKSGFALVAKKDRERAIGNLKKVLEQGSVKNIEYAALTKDGREFQAELSASVIKDSSGNPTGFVAITKDITERRRTEEKIRKEKKFTLSLLKGLKEGFAVVDQEGKQILVNDELCKMTGYSEKELLNQKPPFKYWAEEELKDINEAFEKTLRGVEGGYELIFKRKDGERFIALVSPRKTVDSDGNTIFFATVKDITERKQAEERIRESEGKFRNIFESANDCMIYLDRSGRIIDVNGKAVEVFGGSRKELLGKHFTKVGIFSFREIPTLMSNFAKILAGKKATLNVRIKNKKGREIFLECLGSLMKIDGKLTGMLVIARDITERKKAEGALRESEERFRQFFENEPEYCYMISPEGKILDINRSALKALGYNKNEAIGKPLITTIYAPSSREKAKRLFMKWKKTGKLRNEELNIITKRGEERTVLLSVDSVKNAKGKLLHSILVQRDITPRKQMEEKLRESEERFRNLYESIQDPVGVYVGREGRLIDHNKAFNKLSGYSDEELKDKTFLDFVHPDDRAMVLEKYRTKYPEEELPRVYEIRAVNKKGETIPVEISVSTYKVKGKVVGIEVIHRDITERKKAEEEIKNLARFSSENPSPVLRIAKDGILLYANASTQSLLSEWKTGIGQPVPRHWSRLVADVLSSGLRKEIEVEHRDRIFSFVLVPVTDAAYVNVYGHDVTDRKEKEEALRRSEEQARRLLEFRNKVIDTADVWINLLDAEGNVILWNRAAELISGYSCEEVIGHKKIWGWLYPDPEYRAKIFAQAKKIMEEGERIENDETIVRCKDGTLKTIRWYDNSILDEKGKPVGSIAVGIDITERKKAEEKLRFLKEFNEKVVDSIGDALLVVDPYDYTIISANEAALKQLKLRKEELIGKTCYETTHHRSTPCKPPHDICPIQEMLKTGKTLTVEHTHFDKDNNEIYVEVSAGPVRNQEGNIVQVVHLARDITERRKIEQEIAAQRAFRESVLNSMIDGIATVDLEGVQTYVSPSFCKMVGYEKSELEGSKPPFLYWPPEELEDVKRKFELQALREKNFVQSVETVFRRKNGELFPVSITVSKLKDDQGKVVGSLACVKDLTEKKMMEDKLKEYAEHLEEKVEKRTRELEKTQERLLKAERLAAIGELATMVGHDLRNPLQAIENATYYLNNELPRLPPSIPISQKAVEMLRVISDSVNYADKIIRDLHDFSATRKPTLKKTNINAIVEETLSQVGAPENVELTAELGQLPRIKADKDMIKRVFLNLAVNGIQAMKNGGTLKVSTKKTEGFVEVSFKDTGVGISKENMKKIFTPFFTTKAKGLGMGLPICKKLVDSHGGSIEVESEEGKGSTFTVKLPTQQEKWR